MAVPTAKKPTVRKVTGTPQARPRPGGSGVERLPSGRRPANSGWAGQRYNGRGWTAKMQDRYPDGVRFTDDGFPDFSPYATQTVRFDPRFAGNRGSDFVDANRAAGLPSTPDDYTWHHHQDGVTLQLIPSDLHEAVRHAGGVAIVGGG